MKILSISHMFLTPFDPLDICVFRQMKELAAVGHDVRVLCPLQWVPFPLMHANSRWRGISSVPSRVDWHGITTYYPRYVVFPRAMFLPSAGRRMYRGVEGVMRGPLGGYDFDLIHAHMGHPDGHAGMLLSRESGKPLIVTLQATDLDITAHRDARCLKTLQRTFESADRVISPTPRLAKQLASSFGLEAVTIGYGLDPEEVHPENEELRAKYGDRRVILSVSRLLRSKGIEVMLQALGQIVKRWDDVMYVVVGAGPEGGRLVRLAHDLKLDGHVEFTGQLPHERAMEYMSVCEFFVLPSWQETFGLVYVEAMAHAKSVVAVQGQGVDGIVIHGETGLLSRPKDAGSLVEALAFLLSHPEEAAAMGERARSLVLADYTWQNCGRRTAMVYQEVMARA